MNQHASTAATPTAAERWWERLGMSVRAAEAPALLDEIVAAEALGVRQIWMTQNPSSLDALSIFGAAMAQTERIRLGTSIVPTYPRHPLALAQQAATVDGFGPGRLRLGVGPSHRPVIERTYGLAAQRPLAHLREYVGVLRSALWEGQVDHQGQFFTARASFSSAPRVPLLVSALGRHAFELAGESSDGAISWNCPPAYLTDVALPAMRAAAEAAGRPVPPLVAHVWVALSTDTAAVRAAAQQTLAGYTQLPAYAAMFEAAGYPTAGGKPGDALVDALVVMGDDRAVADRLHELLGGFDELLLTHVPLDEPAVVQRRLMQFLGALAGS